MLEEFSLEPPNADDKYIHALLLLGLQIRIVDKEIVVGESRWLEIKEKSPENSWNW
jgi:hypothetical protein